MNKYEKLAKYLYKIGDFVYVDAFVEFEYDENGNRIPTRKELYQSVTCQIVGAKHKPLGQVVEKNDSAWDEAPNYYTTLDIDGSAFVWEVKQGLLNSIKFALPQDIRFNFTNSTLPIFYSKQPEWTEEIRKEMAEIMKDVPRDKKGRWTK